MRLPSTASSETLAFDTSGQALAFADTGALAVHALPEGRLQQRIGLTGGEFARRVFLRSGQLTVITGNGPYRVSTYPPNHGAPPPALMIDTDDHLQDAVMDATGEHLALVFADVVKTFVLGDRWTQQIRTEASWAIAAIGQGGALFIGTREGVLRPDGSPGSLIGAAQAPYWSAPSLTLSRDGARIALGGASVTDAAGNAAIRVYDISTGRLESETTWPELDDAYVTAVMDTPHGFLAALVERRTPADGGWRLSVHGLQGGPALVEVETGDQPVSSVAISPDGRYMAHMLHGAVELWKLDPRSAAPETPETAAGREKEPTPRLVSGLGHTTGVTAIAATDDLIATADRDGDVWLWTPGAGRALRRIGTGARIIGLAFPDGPARLVVFHERGLTVLDTVTGELLSSADIPAPPPQARLAKLVEGGHALLLCGAPECSLHRFSDRVDRLPRSYFAESPQVFPHAGADWVQGLRGDVCGDVAVLAFPESGVALLDIATGHSAGPFATEAEVRTIACTETALWVGDAAGGLTRHDMPHPDVMTLAPGTRIVPGAERPVAALAEAGAGRLAMVVNGAGYVGRPDDPAELLMIDPDSLAVLHRQVWPEGTAGRSAHIESVAFGGGGDWMVAASQPGMGTAPHLTLWSGDPLVPRDGLGTGRRPVSAVTFTEDGSGLLLRDANQARLWSLESGVPDAPIALHYGDNVLLHDDALLWLSEDGRSLIRASPGRGMERFALPAEDDFTTWRSFVAAPRHAGDRLILFGFDALLVLDLSDEKVEVLYSARFEPGRISSAFAVSPDGDSAVLLEDEILRKIALGDTGAQIWEIDAPGLGTRPELAFSGDGGMIFATGPEGARTFDALKGAPLGPMLPAPPRWEASAPLLAGYDRPDRGDRGALVVPQDRNRALLHLPGAAPVEMPLGGLTPRRVILSDDHALIAVVGYSETLLWHRADGVQHHLPAVPAGEGGLSFAPDGRHLAMAESDGSVGLWRIEDGTLLTRLVVLGDDSWAVVAPDGRYDAADPGDVAGLSWVMQDEPYRAVPVEVFYREFYQPRLAVRLMAGDPLEPLEPPQMRNRIQPRVGIDRVESTADGERVSVTVSVEQGVRGAQTSGLGVIKLFRDGQLVAQKAPPDEGSMSLRTVFPDIRLPVSSTGPEREVEFSAYAFNADDIKSETARARFPLPEQGAPASRRAFVVAIGVDIHADPGWNLRYAVADALAHAELVSEGLRNGGQFDEIITTTLLSAPALGNAPPPRHASRARIEAALAALGGRPYDPALLADVPGASGLDEAGPDDLVYIAFAGHGLTEANGRFHLFTQDLGRSEDLFAESLDSDVLGDLVAAMDAREIVLVIDACHAAASIEGDGFIPGPMGSRGLGQLAYDKGIRVLTGSQAAEEALESPSLQHGVLSFTMLREGLEASAADIAPRDQRISMTELVSYPLTRVPEIHRQVLQGSFSTVARGGSSLLAPAADLESPIPGQTPALFDFRRLSADEPELRIIAR